MKELKNIFGVLILILIMLGMSSCAVRMHENQGRHRGWSKHHNHREYYEHDRRDVLIINSDHNNKKSKEKKKTKNSWNRRK